MQNILMFKHAVKPQHAKMPHECVWADGLSVGRQHYSIHTADQTAQVNIITKPMHFILCNYIYICVCV